MPPALPLSMRQRYDERFSRARSARGLCSDVCFTAGMIERLLNTEEGLVSGLTHNYLFAVQMLCLRQLWQEVQRRQWGEDPLVHFQRALG